MIHYNRGSHKVFARYSTKRIAGSGNEIGPFSENYDGFCESKNSNRDSRNVPTDGSWAQYLTIGKRLLNTLSRRGIVFHEPLRSYYQQNFS